MNKQKRIKAFTLVELIVVVTILAILSTIGFVSYSSYLIWVRDTNRTANMKAISDWLELYRTKYSLPIPEDKVEIKANTTLIARQWYAWANVLESIEFSNGWKDPKDDIYYSYYLTKNKKYFQIMWFLEEEDNLQTNLFHQIGAIDYAIRYPTVYGKKLGMLLWTWVDLNTPIQEISAIALSWSLDIATTIIEYIAILKDWVEISWTWVVLSEIEDMLLVWWKWYKLNDAWYLISSEFTDWRSVDSNCELADVTIWNQTWAWCNSTIWGGNDFVENDGLSCYDYEGGDWTTWCWWSITKENDYNSTYWVDNIWWKLYNWADASTTACAEWYHLPSDSEWTVLENEAGVDCRTSANEAWECYGIWWAWWTHRGSNLVDSLRLPLTWHGSDWGGDFNSRGRRAYYWTSIIDWSNSNPFHRRFEYSYGSIMRSSAYWTDLRFSVRCIKD